MEWLKPILKFNLKEIILKKYIKNERCYFQPYRKGKRKAN